MRGARTGAVRAPRASGHGRDGTSPADRPGVLLVHGIRTSRTMWRRQLEILGAAGHRALAIDLPGHGDRRGEPFTLASARAAIDDGVVALGGRVAVVGLSLGGYLVLHWAARTSHPPERIVVSSCATAPGGWGHVAYLVASELIVRLPARGAERLSEATARWVLGEVAARDIAAGGLAVAAHVPTLRAIRDVSPLDDLARIDVPVTLLDGQWDHFRGGERAYLRAARRAGRAVDVVIVPRANHLVSLHRPVAYARALLGVLERPTGT